MKYAMRNPLMLALAMLVLVACAQNPFNYAKTPLDKAHVALRAVEIVQTKALALVTDPAIPASAKTALKKASQDATLAATQLGHAVIEVEQARAELIAGATTEEKLAIANAKLVQWTNTVLTRITAIKAALKEAA